MKKIIISALFLFISIDVYASSLSIPNEFEFIAVNGHEVTNGLFSKTSDLTLAAGTQKIALLYKTSVRNDLGNGLTRVTSQPLILSLVVNDNEDYHIAMLSQIKKVSDAKAFIQDPQIAVKNAQGELASYTLHQAKMDDSGILGNIIKKKEDNQKTVAVLETLADQARRVKKSEAEKMLHQWWEQADAETQKQFVSWAIKQIK